MWEAVKTPAISFNPSAWPPGSAGETLSKKMREAEQKREARFVWQLRIRNVVAPKLGSAVAVAFEYHPKLIEMIKAKFHPSRRIYRPSDRVWLLGRPLADEFLKELRAGGCFVDETSWLAPDLESEAQAEAAKASRASRFATIVDEAGDE